MLRSFVLGLLPLLLFAAACGSGDESSADSAQERPTDAPMEAIDTSAPAEDSSSAGDDGNGAGGDSFLAGFNPLDLLEAFGGESLALASEIDPAAEAVLIRSEDLPAEFSSVSDLAWSVPSDGGEVEIAGRMFSTGDLEDGDFDDMAPLVVSAVIELPPEAADELERFDELEAELDQYQSEIAELGLGEIQLLDGTDLGDGGVGLRIELDFSGLFGSLLELGKEFAGESADFDVSPGEELLDSGIMIEMYLFPRDERLLFVMVMEPLGQPSGVDSRGLAEIMDERAAEAS